MLQNMTEDRVAAYLVDAGVPVRHIALATGCLGLASVVFWLVVMKQWVRRDG